MEDAAKALYLENQLCFPLYAASRLTTKVYGPLLSELSLTYPQYLVMLVLWQHGSQSVNEIGTKLLLESNTLTPLLKRLEQNGLLTRDRSDEDGRSILVSLTDEGAKLKTKALSIPERLINSICNTSVTMDEARHFQQTLVKLLGTLKEHCP